MTLTFKISFGILFCCHLRNKLNKLNWGVKKHTLKISVLSFCLFPAFQLSCFIALCTVLLILNITLFVFGIIWRNLFKHCLNKIILICPLVEKIYFSSCFCVFCREKDKGAITHHGSLQVRWAPQPRVPYIFGHILVQCTGMYTVGQQVQVLYSVHIPYRLIRPRWAMSTVVIP